MCAGDFCYQIPKTCCIKRLTPVIPTQQKKPIINGFPPVLISLTIFVLRPMATIARTMKNLLRILTGVKTSVETPKLIATVVITEARIKYKMKKGNMLFIFAFSPSDFLFFDWKKAMITVIGMIARVLVSFTVTALSKDRRAHV